MSEPTEKNLGALIITAETLARFREVMAHAKQNRFTLAELVRRMNTGKSIGDDPAYVINVPNGWQIVYSIEEQPAPIDWTVHLSFSVEHEGARVCPPLKAVVAILPFFNLRSAILVHSYVEKWEGFSAGNLIFKYNE